MLTLTLFFIESWHEWNLKKVDFKSLLDLHHRHLGHSVCLSDELDRESFFDFVDGFFARRGCSRHESFQRVQIILINQWRVCQKNANWRNTSQIADLKIVSMSQITFELLCFIVLDMLAEKLSVKTGQYNSSVAKPQTAQRVAQPKKMIERQEKKGSFTVWLIIRTNKRDHFVF